MTPSIGSVVSFQCGGELRYGVMLSDLSTSTGAQVEIAPLQLQNSNAHGVILTLLHPHKDFSEVAISPTLFVESTTVFSDHGALASDDTEKLLRALVQHRVSTYQHAIHAPKQLAPFTVGDRISYAGRVFDGEEIASLTDATLDFWLTTGRFSEQFEREFAKKLGVRFAALVNSGSSANLVAVSALTSPLLGADRLRAGDEVITVAAGFPTTVAPIIQNNLVPVFVDITVDDGTYNIDVTQLEAARSPRTRAVMVAHTLGNPFNLSAVTEFCTKHDLYLIEDNCDALGSTYNGKLTGTFGDLATSSFYPPHHMTMGEGGAVYSSTLKYKRAVESIRDWGRDCWCAAGKDNTCGIRFGQQLGTLPKGYDHKYTYSHFGYNLKVSDMQAAIGCAQLKKIDSFIAARRKNFALLRETLASLEEFFILPSPTPHSDPSWFGFLLTLKEDGPRTRHEIVSFLEARNIQTRMLFAGNLTRQPSFIDLHTQNPAAFRVVGDLSQTDRVMNQTFWLGVYPGLKPGMVEYMAESVREALL